MSADNCVAVLEYGSVYRVQELGMPSLENPEYFYRHGLIDEKEMWKQITKVFRKAPVFSDKGQALVYASTKDATEYGMINIVVPKKFL